MMMIEDWIGNHKWEATEEQKRSILTFLFYAIWNKRDARHQPFPSRPIHSFLPRHVQSPLVPTQSTDCETEKHSAPTSLSSFTLFKIYTVTSFKPCSVRPCTYSVNGLRNRKRVLPTSLLALYLTLFPDPRPTSVPALRPVSLPALQSAWSY